MVGGVAGAECTMETCVYPVRFSSEPTLVMLCRAVAGHNAGKWVPLGSVIEPNQSPRTTAARDLLLRHISVERLTLRGLVTEIGMTGWQTVLFLYAAPTQSALLPTPDDFADEYRWFKAGEVGRLPQPQADSLFSPRIFEAEGFFFEADMAFDAQGVLTTVTSY